MNDVLLAALHIAIADWNEEHRTGARGIAVMVPVSLRPSDWQQEVVSNRDDAARFADGYVEALERFLAL